LTRATELLDYEARQAELLISQAQKRGWAGKVELLTARKKELEAKIARCQKLLTSKWSLFLLSSPGKKFPRLIDRSNSCSLSELSNGVVSSLQANIFILNFGYFWAKIISPCRGLLKKN